MHAPSLEVLVHHSNRPSSVLFSISYLLPRFLLALLFTASVSQRLCSLFYGDFLDYWFALPKTSLRSVPGTALQMFQLKSHQHEPQEFIQFAPPHSKACARHNSSFHRNRAKPFSDTPNGREATTTGASDSLPRRPLLEIQLHR